MTALRRLAVRISQVVVRLASPGAKDWAKATAREVELIRPDWFFLGACGADADAGITAFDFDEGAFKRRVAAVSKAVLVAATIDKLGTAAPYLVLPSRRLSHLVIEHDADAAQAEAFAALGVQVLRAPAAAIAKVPA